MRPLARRDALLLQTVGSQLVVYDRKRRRLHVLNRSAALVWQHCNGQRDLAQLAQIVGRELGTPADDEVIRLALQKLDDAELLIAWQDSAPHADAVSRREMMSRAMGGLAAAVLMPVVTSCGSIAESVVGAMRPSNVNLNVITTTTTLLPGTTTTSTSPLPGTTTTSTSPLPGTTTTTTSPLPGTTTTTTTSPAPGTTTTTTSPLPGTTTTTTSPLPGTTTTTTSPLPGTTTTTTTTATTTTPLPKKVQMCHNGKTIMVDSRAVSAHLAKGDTLGPCRG